MAKCWNVLGFVLIGVLSMMLQPVFAQNQTQTLPNFDTQCERLEFSDLNTVTDSLGGVRVLGKITNNSTSPLSGVTIISEFYDKDGRLVDVRNEYPSIANLNPNESSPFKIPSDANTRTVGNITLNCGAILNSQTLNLIR